MLRSIAQKIFSELFNDSISPNNKDGFNVGSSFYKNFYFSKAGRMVHISSDNQMDRTNLKLGQKPYKVNRKSNSYVLRVELTSEYGTHKETGDSVDEIIQRLKYDLANESKNPDWVPMTMKKFIFNMEQKYQAERDIYRKKEDEKKLKEFDSIYSSWIKVADLLGMKTPDYNNLSDDEKLQFVKQMEWMSNIIYHKVSFEKENYAQTALNIIEETFQPDERSDYRYVLSFGLPILKAAGSYLTRYTSPNGGNAWALEREIREKQQGIE